MQILKHPIQEIQELRLLTPLQLEQRTPAKPLGQRVTLDFSTLTVFELVQEQFQSFGIGFENAIAIPPSNPAFQTDANQLVLMPIAGQTTITAHFQQPQRQVQAHLTGARRIRLTAYGSEEGAQRQYTPQAQALLGQATPIAFPSHLLELESDRITQVTFDSPAPFLLSGFCYQG